MKYLFLLILTFIAFSNAYSQINTEEFNSPTYYLREFEIKEPTKTVVIGSPYRYDEFNSGEIFFKKKDKPVNYLLNLNSYKDEIEFKKDEFIYYFFNSDEIAKIIVNNDVLLYLNYELNDSISKGFFVEVVKDSISLYKRDNIKLVPPRKARNPYDNDDPAKFQKLKTQYFVSINKTPAFFIKNKKTLLKRFENNSGLNDYLKKEKIDLASEEDLKRLVIYLNKRFD